MIVYFQELFATSLSNKDLEDLYGTEDGELSSAAAHSVLKEVRLIGVIH